MGRIMLANCCGVSLHCGDKVNLNDEMEMKSCTCTYSTVGNW